jgi:DNA mismatch repair ATPase MutS
MLRLGDFYEAFGNGAKQLANTLDLTLTGRDVGLPERVPMVGIPYHAVDAYIQKAINGGLKIALAEDINGDNATTYPTQNHTTIDEETGEILYDDIPTYDEMKEFDGDIDEVVPTVSRLTEGIEIDDDNDYIQALEQSKAFNPAALAILLDKFGDDITIL